MTETILDKLTAAKASRTPVRVRRQLGASSTLYPALLVHDVREEKRRGWVVVFHDLTNCQVAKITSVEVAS